MSRTQQESRGRFHLPDAGGRETAAKGPPARGHGERAASRGGKLQHGLSPAFQSVLRDVTEQEPPRAAQSPGTGGTCPAATSSRRTSDKKNVIEKKPGLQRSVNA